MKKLFIAMVALGCGLAAMAVLQAQTSGTESEHAWSGLPASLAGYYPPKSPAPVYLLEMHQLSKPLSGITSDLFEGDVDNARQNFETFKHQYVKVAAMIPEWSAAFPLDPVNQLDEALNSGEQPRVLAAAQQVGQVCDACHHANMPAAQQEFRWGDFSALTVSDPLSGKDVSFRQIMLMMESNMTGTALDLSQGQVENARKQLAGFEARFGAIAQSCAACHDTERKYFVDGEITKSITALKDMLAGAAVDGQEAGKLLQTVGQESCGKCHLVHIPAAYAQARAATRM